MLEERRDPVPARTLARLAGSLAGTGSRSAFVRLVTDLPRHVLDVPAVGVLLVDHDGVLVTGGSPEHERFVELFEQQATAGPVRECFQAGQSVSLSREDALAQGHVDLAEAMLRAGVTAVDAVPLRVHRETLGVLAVYLDTPPTAPYRRLNQLVQAVAGLGLTAHELRHDLCSVTETVEELTVAMGRRAKVEQATGVIAEHCQVTIGDAASMMRECAQARRLTLHELSNQILAGRTDIFD